MELEVWPSTSSSVPTEPSSTRTTLSVTGGSTSTAPPLRSSIPSMKRLLLKKNLSMLLPLLMPQSPPTELLKMPLSMKVGQRDEEEELEDRATEEETSKNINHCN